jgi:hypothetical protein
MKVKQINVGFKFTKNLGNYQSVTAEAGIVAEIDEKDDMNTAFDIMWTSVKEEVRKTINQKGAIE